MFILEISLFNGYHSVILIANKVTTGATIKIDLTWKDQHNVVNLGSSGIDKKVNDYIVSFIAFTKKKHQEKTAKKVYGKTYAKLSLIEKKEVDARIKKTWEKDLKITKVSQLLQKQMN